jgi:uncharacterized membrane protein
MLVSNMSIIGWLHSIACTLALVIGASNNVLAKGTPLHRRAGRLYAYTMLFANLSAFGVYHFDIAHFRPFTAGASTFGIFHWEAVATLVLLGLGVYAARRQSRAVWAYTHPIAMLLTYYMLIGGLINELFVRVAALHALAMAHAPHAINIAATPVVGMTQFAAMLLFAALILAFAIKTAVHRRAAGRAVAMAAA